MAAFLIPASSVSQSELQSFCRRAWCNTPAYEAYDEYWVSYNPKIAAKKLKPFCFEEMENKPSDQAVSQMLKNKDVFRFGFPAN